MSTPVNSSSRTRPRISLVPVTRTINADLETPASVYMKLAGKKPSFLLESVTGGEQLGRYSFIGVDIDEAFIFQGTSVEIRIAGKSSISAEHAGSDPFDILRECLRQVSFQPKENLPRFSGGLAGYIGYGVAYHFEPTIGMRPHSTHPEAIFLLTRSVVAFDHAYGSVQLIVNAQVDDDQEAAIALANRQLDDLEERIRQPVPVPPLDTDRLHSAEFKSNFSKGDFQRAVMVAKEHIHAGDVFQVVLSQRFSRHTTAAPFSIYRALRRLNPSPYMFFFDFGSLGNEGEPLYMIGASPEMHVRLENGTASLRPLAGTRRRGRNNAEDQALEKELLADSKECAEHLMLVDLGRNDLGRVCQVGSVEVVELMEVERYSHVMHIVSHLQGRLQEGLDGFDLMAATFPAGTVTGAPKIRAMQIIGELEPDARGPYAGAVGYFSFDGSLDSCIAIRTLVMQDGILSLQAGAGIVADSVPASEYEETVNKAFALAEAVVRAEGGRA